ncbi:unnamed protein product [Closterium sp. Naga37s-1]|nr:unnamed protein product [Closterium sp. Naga37s-1]
MDGPSLPLPFPIITSPRACAFVVLWFWPDLSPSTALVAAPPPNLAYSPSLLPALPSHTHSFPTFLVPHPCPCPPSSSQVSASPRACARERLPSSMCACVPLSGERLPSSMCAFVLQSGASRHHLVNASPRACARVYPCRVSASPRACARVYPCRVSASPRACARVYPSRVNASPRACARVYPSRVHQGIIWF